MEDSGDESVASTGPADGGHGDGHGDDGHCDGEPERDQSKAETEAERGSDADRDRTEAEGGSDADRDPTEAEGGSDAEGGGGGRTVGASPSRAWRRAPRPVVLAAGIALLATLTGGVAVASRVDGDAAAPSTTRPHPRAERSSTTTIDIVTTTASTAPTTTTTTQPTTTTTVPPATTPPSTSTQVSTGNQETGTTAPAPPVPSGPTCGPYPWPPSGGSLPAVPVGPGQAAAYGPPTTACSDVAQGCSVSFTLKWSDGYTETRSQVLTGPGSYTLSGDRGTTWSFAVSGDLYCTSSGGNYSNVWPGGT